MKSVLVYLTLIVFLTGCGTTGKHLQWYSGPPKGPSETAPLNIQKEILGTRLQVNKVDGTPLNKGKWYVENNTRLIEFLPGHYDLMVEYTDSDSEHSIQDGAIGFEAKAGKVYDLRGAPQEKSFLTELRLDTTGGRWHWLLWICDEQTGEVIAGTPRTAPVHWYEK